MKRLQKEIPGIRIAIIAHGDYCDSDVYVTKILDFTTDEKKLCSFVENVASTGKYIIVMLKIEVKATCTYLKPL